MWPEHYRERSAESFGSSFATLASPSARIGSSSCGSRRALDCSFLHWGPCRPLPGSSTTPTAGPTRRIGGKCALPDVRLRPCRLGKQLLRDKARKRFLSTKWQGDHKWNQSFRHVNVPLVLSHAVRPVLSLRFELVFSHAAPRSTYTVSGEPAMSRVWR